MYSQKSKSLKGTQAQAQLKSKTHSAFVNNSTKAQEDRLIQAKIKSNSTVQLQKNKTGLPDQLKSGAENLSGYSLDHVKVHYNSSKPATVQAHAYAQGSNIHLASGQEKHLPHETWHVVQQMQGRVKPTTSVGGMAVNDSVNLETEADIMGGKAIQMKVRVYNDKSKLQFEDNRPESVTKKKIQRKLMKSNSLNCENKYTNTNEASFSTIQRVATPDLAASNANRGYINANGFPDVTNQLNFYNNYLDQQLLAFQANTGITNPAVGTPLDLAASGLYRFTERIIEQADGFWAEISEASRLAQKPRATVPMAGPIPMSIPGLGIPGVNPDIIVEKAMAGVTGREMKSVNGALTSDVTGAINDAEGQLAGFAGLNTAKIIIKIMHQTNRWPGVVGGHGNPVTRTTDAALEAAIDAKLNTMALPTITNIVIENVNVNYTSPGGGAPSQIDVRATGVNGAWNSQVL